MEKLRRKTIFFFQSVIESPVPIFIISCNGMTDGCKMGTDLMRLSGDQMNLQERDIFFLLYYMIFCLNRGG